jgi:hypothetical protein
MATIIQFLRAEENAFDPKDIAAMSMALDDICNVLNVHDNSSAKEVTAARIIDLARTAERNSTRLRDRVLHEAGFGARPCFR